MYIHPFLAGVIATVLAELLLLVVSVIHATNKYGRKEHKRETSQESDL